MDFKNGIANSSNTESFLTVFEKYWEKRLNTLNTNLVLNKQLLHGSRMRPILAAWGYYFNSPDEVNGEISEDLLKLCFSLELLHKSSIIIDDLIDQDEKRKGEATFHTEFGDYKAILFALLLIGKAFENLYSITGNSDILFGKELASTLVEMSTGAINELSLSSQDIINIEKINLIINQETTSLIRNSLYLGFSLSANMGLSELSQIIENLGEQFGYLFQILNDLEPFTSAEINQNYKGKKNFDIQNNRKNYVVAFLYGIASAKDRKKLEKVIDDIDNSNSEKELMLLINKYSICEKILDKAESIQVEIFDNLELLSNYSEDNNFTDQFKAFIKDMISVSYSKLGIDKRF